MLIQNLTKFIQDMVMRKEKYFNLVAKNDEYLKKAKSEIKKSFINELMDQEAKIVNLEKDLKAKKDQIKFFKEQVASFDSVKKR